MSLNESTVEAAALEWFGALGYAVGHGPNLAPGEPMAERDSFGDVVLVGRLREAIHRLNPKIPEEAREDALRKVLRVATPSLIGTNRLFHAMLRDGVEVEYRRKSGDGIAGDRVQLVDYSRPDANDWFAVNQFTVIEGQINRRPDVAVRRSVNIRTAPSKPRPSSRNSSSSRKICATPTSAAKRSA